MRPGTHIKLLASLLTLIGAALFLIHQKFGLQVLDPTHHSWIFVLGSDIAPDYFHWEFFRITPWQWPLGVIEIYSHPAPASAGLTGGIPLLGLFFKSLDAYLPQTFQYFGWWYFGCFLLQGLLGAALMRVIGVRNTAFLLLSGLFFMLSTPLLDRDPHVNLCGHWLILAPLVLYFCKGRHAHIGAICLGHSLLAAMSVWVHPYLILFPLFIALAHYVKLFAFERAIKWYQWLMCSSITAASVAVAWYTIGNQILPTEQGQVAGFGQFSANLNTFFNPFERAQLLPSLPVAFPGQYEGYAYLGGGLLALGVIALIGAFTRLKDFRISKGLWPILALAFGFFCLSLSNVITFNGKVLGEIPLPERIEALMATFRSSGRYVWLAYYLLMAGILYGFSRMKIHTSLKIGLIVLAFALQYHDLSSMLHRRFYRHDPYQPPLQTALWQSLYQASDQVVMYPLYQRKYRVNGDDMYFLQLAYENKTPITAGHLARFDQFARWDYEAFIHQQLDNPQPDSSLDQALFITTERHADRFYPAWKAGRLFPFVLDKYLLFVPGTHSQALTLLREQQIPPLKGRVEYVHDFLRQYQPSPTLIVARGEATKNLCEETKDYLRKRGSRIGQLAFRGSYIALMRGDSVLMDTVNNEAPIRLNWEKGQQLGDILLPYPLVLESAGDGRGSIGSILLDGQEHSPRLRGLNIVVLDEELKPAATAGFDTFDKCSRFLKEEK